MNRYAIVMALAALVVITIVIMYIRREKYTNSLTHTAYYANWAQFWNGGATYNDQGNPIQNCPATFSNFLGSGKVDKIIYGVVMFGIMPNPLLTCMPGVDIGDMYCRYNTALTASEMAETIFGYSSYAAEEALLPSASYAYDLLMNAKDLTDYASEIAAGSSEPQVYEPSNTYATFPMYPNVCFTGSQSIADKSWFGGAIVVNDPLWKGKCPSKGRLDDYKSFAQLNALKSQNPSLKLIASYGGWTWTHGPAAFYPASQNLFSQMVSNKANRAQFIEASYEYLKAQGFDGADFDWEYPGENNSPYDFYGLEQLITEFKSAHPDFILSMQCSGFLSWDSKYAVLPGYSSTISMLNDADYFSWINRLLSPDVGLDEVNIMAYDYYTAVTTNDPIPANGSLYSTRPNTPMYCGLYEDTDYTNASYPWINPSLTSSDYNTALNQSGKESFCPTTYTVQSGDSYWSISQKYPPLTYQEIEDANPSIPASSLSVGAVINIPCSASVPTTTIPTPTQTPTSCPTTYTVQSGDSYWSISQKFPPLTYQEIQNANPSIPASSLSVGSVITIPCSAPVPTTTKPIVSVGLIPDINSGVGDCLLKTLTIMRNALGSNMSKVLLGLACYGRSFSGVNFAGLSGSDLIQNSVGLPCQGGGWIPGNNAYVNQQGVLTYYDIVETYGKQWTATGYNQKYGIAVAVDVPNGIWVSYDDPVSIKAKMDLAKSFGVGGVMSFTPQQDDWTAGYPLMSTIGSNL